MNGYEKYYTKWWNRKRALVFVVTRWNKKVLAKIRRFHGIQTIAWVKVSDGMQLEFQIEIQEGEAKLMLIHRDEWILMGESSCQGITPPLQAGFYRIRVVGNRASLNCTIQKNAQHI
jgi:hypothetical protein